MRHGPRIIRARFHHADGPLGLNARFVFKPIGRRQAALQWLRFPLEEFSASTLHKLFHGQKVVKKWSKSGQKVVKIVVLS